MTASTACELLERGLHDGAGHRDLTHAPNGFCFACESHAGAVAATPSGAELLRRADEPRVDGLTVEALAKALRTLGFVRGVANRYGRFNDAYWNDSALAILELLALANLPEPLPPEPDRTAALRGLVVDKLFPYHSWCGLSLTIKEHTDEHPATWLRYHEDTETLGRRWTSAVAAGPPD